MDGWMEGAELVGGGSDGGERSSDITLPLIN